MRILGILHFYRHRIRIIFTDEVESEFIYYLANLKCSQNNKSCTQHPSSPPKSKHDIHTFSSLVICSANLRFASTPIFRTSKKQPEVKSRTKPVHTMEPPITLASVSSSSEGNALKSPGMGTMQMLPQKNLNANSVSWEDFLGPRQCEDNIYLERQTTAR